MGFDVNEAMKSDFITMEELVEGGPVTDRIADSDANQSGPFLMLDGGRKVGLNKSSIGILAEAFGTDSEKWNGRKVVVAAEDVKTREKGYVKGKIVRPADADTGVSDDGDDDLPF